jgi:hypothetical protein
VTQAADTFSKKEIVVSAPIERAFHVFTEPTLGDQQPVTTVTAMPTGS